MDYPCLYCSTEVRPRQHAISCDICSGWQHRTCNTGITLAEYRDAVRNNTEIHFVCIPCLRRELEPEQDDDIVDSLDDPHDESAMQVDNTTVVDDIEASFDMVEIKYLCCGS